MIERLYHLAYHFILSEKKGLLAVNNRLQGRENGNGLVACLYKVSILMIDIECAKKIVKRVFYEIFIF